MFDNFIFPFICGFFVIIIPLALYVAFYLFLLLTLGVWHNFEKAESLKKRAISLFFFFMIQCIIIFNANYFLISPELLERQDLNSKQVLSCYCGFVVIIILTRKTFGNKILKANILGDKNKSTNFFDETKA